LNDQGQTHSGYYRQSRYVHNHTPRQNLPLQRQVKHLRELELAIGSEFDATMRAPRVSSTPPDKLRHEAENRELVREDASLATRLFWVDRDGLGPALRPWPLAVSARSPQSSAAEH
jgi:hypothetical protein